MRAHSARATAVPRGAKRRQSRRVSLVVVPLVVVVASMPTVLSAAAEADGADGGYHQRSLVQLVVEEGFYEGEADAGVTVVETKRSSAHTNRAGRGGARNEKTASNFDSPARRGRKRCHGYTHARAHTHKETSVCVFVFVCVYRPISYFIMHIQTMHPKTHRATYILAPGLMNAENPVGP